MAITVWRGVGEFDKTHEAEDAAAFIAEMQRTYGNDADNYHILLNFLVNDRPIDMAVLKNRAFLLVEMKRVGGPVTGGENGPWTIRDGATDVVLRGGQFPNPYVQVRTYRHELIEYLRRNAARFLNRAPDQIRLDQVHAIIALAPRVPDKSRLDIPQSPWFKLVGLDQLHLEVFRRHAREMNFSANDQKRLLERVLRLEPVDIYRYIARPEAAVPPGPVFAAQPPPPPSTQAISATPVITTAPTSAEEPDHAHGDDFVSVLTGEQAPVPNIRGTVLDVTTTPDGKTRITLETHAANREQAIIVADSAETRPLRELHAALGEQMKQRQRIIGLSAYHLFRQGETYMTNDNSLLILEPDWLINVTDLVNVDFCDRKLMLSLFAPFGGNAATLRGSLVHSLAPDLWDAQPAHQHGPSADALLAKTAYDLVVLSASPAAIKADAEPHIASLRQWFGLFADNRPAMRSETFLIEPRLGLKGRIDAVWERDARVAAIGEFKTSKSWGREANYGHQLQTFAYTLMLAVKKGLPIVNGPDPWIIYTGNELLGGQPHNIGRKLQVTWPALKKAVLIRNELVKIELTHLAHAPTNPNKCRGCKEKTQCQALRVVLGNPEENIDSEIAAGAQSWDAVTASFFQHYRQLLTQELEATKESQAALWRRASRQRVEAGEALYVSRCEPVDAPGEHRYRLLTPDGANTAEFREMDTVLLSSRRDGPLKGRVAMASITKTLANGIEVLSDEPLQFTPVLVDPYEDESLAKRPFAGLYRFITSAHPALAQAIIQNTAPAMAPNLDASSRAALTAATQADPNLNPEQSQALERSLRCQSLLLIQGPPGTGKTRVIRNIVASHLKLGRRILIAAGTHRAVDEALERVAAGPDKDLLLRLGSKASVHEALQPFTIEALAAGNGTLEERTARACATLANRTVIGTTVASLMSGRYDGLLGQIDLVILDEAGQLPAPLALGALSYGTRAVVIGDHKQLPPIVRSEGRASRRMRTEAPSPDELQPLSVSLFEILFERYKGTDCAVTLRDQYRMNDPICRVASTTWYEDALKPATDQIAVAQLAITRDATDPVWPILSPAQPVVFVDTPTDPAGGPRTNPREAQTILACLESLEKAGLPLQRQARGAVAPVAVISPYRAQVALLRRVLTAKFGDRNGFWRESVDTVDRFQGGEAQVVFISLASGNQPPSPHVSDEHRLNVACTRARFKLVMLGNKATLSRDPVFFKLFHNMDECLAYRQWTHSSRATGQE